MGEEKLVKSCHFLLKWLNQATKVSGCVLGGVDFASFYGFSIEF